MCTSMTPPPVPEIQPIVKLTTQMNSTDQGSQLVGGRPVGQVTSSGKN